MSIIGKNFITSITKMKNVVDNTFVHNFSSTNSIQQSFIVLLETVCPPITISMDGITDPVTILVA